MIRPDEDALAEQLDNMGYRVKDPCRLLIALSAALAADLPPGPRTIASEGPVARMEEIWATEGVGPARIATMARVTGPKAYIAGRVGNRPAGVVFVAARGGVAMFHALAITAEHRRRGLARDLVAATGHWAMTKEVPWMSLIVTEANIGARALYSSMGFVNIGGYHYRLKEDTA